MTSITVPPPVSIFNESASASASARSAVGMKSPAHVSLKGLPVPPSQNLAENSKRLWATVTPPPPDEKSDSESDDLIPSVPSDLALSVSSVPVSSGCKPPKKKKKIATPLSKTLLSKTPLGKTKSKPETEASSTEAPKATKSKPEAAPKILPKPSLEELVAKVDDVINTTFPFRVRFHRTLDPAAKDWMERTTGRVIEHMWDTKGNLIFFVECPIGSGHVTNQAAFATTALNIYADANNEELKGKTPNAWQDVWAEHKFSETTPKGDWTGWKRLKDLFPQEMRKATKTTKVFLLPFLFFLFLFRILMDVFFCRTSRSGCEIIPCNRMECTRA